MDKKSDCEPINIDIVNKVKPNMPDMNLFTISILMGSQSDFLSITLLYHKWTVVQLY